MGPAAEAKRPAIHERRVVRYEAVEDAPAAHQVLAAGRPRKRNYSAQLGNLKR